MKSAQSKPSKQWTPTAKQMRFIRYMQLKEARDGMCRIGNALSSVRELQAWRAKYSSFEEWCLKDFGLKKSTAYALMKLNATPQGLHVDEDLLMDLAETVEKEMKIGGKDEKERR